MAGVVGRSQHRGSLAGAYEVKVTLALAHELMTALVEDHVLINTIHGGQTGTGANLIHIICSVADTTASLHQQFSSIEYDTPEFHALAAEIANYLKRKKIKDVVDLCNSWMERDMMWYAYHYAEGSHSYAGSLCHDIVRYGREVLSQERREFVAFDIRREISWHLNIPLNFHLPTGAERRLDPIDLLMDFLVKNDIQKEEQLAKYRWIGVKENPDGSIGYETRLEEDEKKRNMSYFFSSIRKSAIFP